MSNVIIKDLNESKSMDRAAMSGVRGGLTIGSVDLVVLTSATSMQLTRLLSHL